MPKRINSNLEVSYCLQCLNTVGCQEQCQACKKNKRWGAGMVVCLEWVILTKINMCKMIIFRTSEVASVNDWLTDTLLEVLCMTVEILSAACCWWSRCWMKLTSSYKQRNTMRLGYFQHSQQHSNDSHMNSLCLKACMIPWTEIWCTSKHENMSFVFKNVG